MALAPADLPRLAETSIDQWVLAFTFGISIITSLLFGLIPAVYASKLDLNDALKRAAGRSVMGGGMVRVRGSARGRLKSPWLWRLFPEQVSSSRAW